MLPIRVSPAPGTRQLRGLAAFSLSGLAVLGRLSLTLIKPKIKKRLYGDRSSVTVEPTFVKRYMKALANRDFCKKKETGHPLRYSLYQNWCPVMVQEMGLEPTRRLPHAPQTCLSTYSNTLAWMAATNSFPIIPFFRPIVNSFFLLLRKIPSFPGTLQSLFSRGEIILDLSPGGCYSYSKVGKDSSFLPDRSRTLAARAEKEAWYG